MRIGLIGGTGALRLLPAGGTRSHAMDTPYGPPSAPLVRWEQAGHELYFLPRHGPDGTIPPHCVNYRANVWALHELAPVFVLGINAVGGISVDAVPGMLAFPDQLVDYTWGREHTYEEHTDRPLKHVDFTLPFSPVLRESLRAAATAQAIPHLAGGCYGVTQGPRLETAAEIDRLERDGCDLVGMTAMPEAGLARELALDYACCAVVVNHAAGRGPVGSDIHAQIGQSIERGMAGVRQLLAALLDGR